MDNSIKYSKKYNIEISDVDFAKALKLSALFNYLQDIASEAAESLGAGINSLSEQFGVTWMLIRMRVDIIRTPLWNEEISIETWHHQPGRLEFQRDFKVHNSKGELIALAVSSWVLVDIATRELRKTDLLVFNSSTFINEPAIDCKLGKLKFFSNTVDVYKKTIGYSDIDLNGHINNSRYIDFVMDCLSMEEHEKYNVSSIEINYLSEALPGDSLVLKKDTSTLNSNLLYIEGVSEKYDKIVFKSQMVINTKY